MQDHGWPPSLPDESYAADADLRGNGPTPRIEATFPLIRASDIEARDPDFVVDGLIETDSMSEIFGDPGSGKSFIAIDLAASIATGTAFHGREVKRGPVVYLAGEGHNGLRRRLSAWERARGVDISDAPLFFSKRSARFLDGAAAQEVSRAVDRVARAEGVPRLIVIDTVSRALAGGDENSTSDMAKFVAAIEDLGERHPGATVLLVHHVGHGDKRRARGSIALKAALDTEFLAEKSGDIITLENTKTKDADPPEPLSFRLESIEIGTAQDGSAITSAALALTGTPPAPKKRLSGAKKVALDTFMMAKHRAGHGDDIGASIYVEEWREIFYEKSTADTQNAKKTAFQRARNALVQGGDLTVSNDNYTLARIPEGLDPW